MSKPREFWLEESAPWEIYETEINLPGHTHVIEYSAFDQLRADAEKLAEALVASCICGEFGFISEKCPACVALADFRKRWPKEHENEKDL